MNCPMCSKPRPERYVTETCTDCMNAIEAILKNKKPTSSEEPS